MKFRNWSRTVNITPNSFLHFTDPEEVVNFLKSSDSLVRTTGAAHSFSPLCATTGTLLKLQSHSGHFLTSPEQDRVSASAFYRLNVLTKKLFAQGMALENQGDIDSQTLAGAIATGTHGTGKSLGCLSSSVRGFDMALANGDVIRCDAESHDYLLDLGTLSLGTLGIVLSYEIQTKKARVLQDRQWSMTLTEALESASELASQNLHYEFFWFPWTEKVLAKSLNPVSTKQRKSRLKRQFDSQIMENGIYKMLVGASRFHPKLASHFAGITSKFLPVGTYSDEAHLVFPSPRKIRFKEMEFAIAPEDLTSCINEIKALIEKMRVCTILPVEVRWVKADTLALSPFYLRDSVAISLHLPKTLKSEDFFKAAQRVFESYRGRPHWGKIHYCSKAYLEDVLPRFQEFIDIRRELDPANRFLNPYLTKYFA